MLSGRALTLRVASAARSYFLLSLFSRFLSFSLVPLSPFPSLLFSPFPLIRVDQTPEFHLNST